MGSRKKLIISLSSLGLAIVAAIGITFGVLAAQTQAVVNTFTVSYTANNVAASAFAKYKLKNSSSYTYFTGGNDTITVKNGDFYTAAEINAMSNEEIADLYEDAIPSGEATDPEDQKTALLAMATTTSSVAALTFVPADSTNSSDPGTLTVGSTIAFEAGNEYAVMAYGFKNNASTNGAPMYVTLTDASIVNQSTENVKVYYYVSSSADETVANIKGVEDANLYTGSTAKTLSTTAIAAGDTLFVYILVQINDDTLPATYASDSTNGISWALSTTNPNA